MQNNQASLSVIGALGIASLFSSHSFAGDASTLNVLGFTVSGDIFVFEEFGTQDGSGFPYANRFYIDTSTDEFIAGSPIRVRLDDEMQTVEAARDQAKLQGDVIVADSALRPAYMAGFNAITELSADPFRMSVNPRMVVPPIDRPTEFRLTEKQFAASATCTGIQDVSVGFTLTMIGIEPGQQAKLLHDDSAVPASRNCAIGYRIGGVYTYFPDDAAPVYAVTIAVQSFGFEGPDYRWMAVTTRNMAAAQP